jgi:TP901-1 family phage major tail protein
MTSFVGRQALLKKGANTLMGMRTKSYSWGSASIDITTDEDAGIRTLLAASGQEQLDITFDGITKDAVIRAIALTPATSKLLTDVTLVMGTGQGTISGNFRLTAFEEGMPYQDATTFSGSLESSGAWVYTATP